MRPFFLSLLLLTAFQTLHARGNDSIPCPVIPFPSSVTSGEGSFTIDRQTTLAIAAAPGIFNNEEAYLQHMIRSYLGQAALKTVSSVHGHTILLQQDASLEGEAYRLTAGKERVVLTAGTGAGMFYAIQTLRQLLPASLTTPPFPGGA